MEVVCQKPAKQSQFSGLISLTHSPGAENFKSEMAVSSIYAHINVTKVLKYFHSSQLVRSMNQNQLLTQIIMYYVCTVIPWSPKLEESAQSQQEMYQKLEKMECCSGHQKVLN